MKKWITTDIDKINILNVMADEYNINYKINDVITLGSFSFGWCDFWEKENYIFYDKGLINFSKKNRFLKQKLIFQRKPGF